MVSPLEAQSKTLTMDPDWIQCQQIWYWLLINGMMIHKTQKHR